MSDAPVLEVGRIGRAHGLRGELAVTFSSDRPERTAPGAMLVARPERGPERELVVADARRHQQRWLVRFEGITDRDAASTLTGAVLYAGALPPEGDELWVHDLVGAMVVDTAEHELGTIVAIEANPAHDLLVLESGALIPMTFVVEARDACVVVDVPDGLLEL